MQPLSWKDIVRLFEAQRLVQAIRISLDDAHLLALTDKADIPADSPVIAGLLKTIRPEIEKLFTACQENDLRLSMIAVERVLRFCDQTRLMHLIRDNLCDNVKRAIMQVEDELSLRSFFALEPNEADYYNKPWEGWEKIAKEFEDTNRDIEEMNKCFAFARYPASMFHAMHVAEWGAIKLGDYIGVADPKKGWGATKKRLAELVKGGHHNPPAELASKWDFIEQMNREIDSLTLAWRHKVDHAANHLAVVPNAEFTPDIAKHIIGAIRVFMLRLVEECS